MMNDKRLMLRFVGCCTSFRRPYDLLEWAVEWTDFIRQLAGEAKDRRAIQYLRLNIPSAPLVRSDA